MYTIEIVTKYHDVKDDHDVSIIGTIDGNTYPEMNDGILEFQIMNAHTVKRNRDGFTIQEFDSPYRRVWLSSTTECAHPINNVHVTMTYHDDDGSICGYHESDSRSNIVRRLVKVRALIDRYAEYVIRN